MKSLLFHILTLLFFANIGRAQIEYTPSELQSFVRVYMDAKSAKSIDNYANLLHQKMNTYAISNTRYQEMLHTRESDKSLILTPNEKLFIKEIQASNEKLKAEKNNTLSKLCADRSLNLTKYNEITHLYKTDIKFQRSLKPYFDNYIKAKR